MRLFMPFEQVIIPSTETQQKKKPPEQISFFYLSSISMMMRNSFFFLLPSTSGVCFSVLASLIISYNHEPNLNNFKQYHNTET